jgi:catechol 2,3-dioxygenase-like lactoylglutathione lyase family enzyme
MGIIRYSLTALDCPDPLALATFYSRVTGLAIAPTTQEPPDVTWVELVHPGAPTLAFQRVASYVAPTWPEGPVPQQLHLDFEVDDLDEGERAVRAAGATRAAVQPGETGGEDHFRVFLDPVGHPFCLVLRSGESDTPAAP